MNEKIFRQKSLDRVKSPEALEDYIQVSNPGVWLLLCSIMFILAGACVWGIFGRIDSTVPANIYIEDGVTFCPITEENITVIREGMTVRVEGVELTVDRIENNSREYTAFLEGEKLLPDGVYKGKVVTGSIKPFSFIMN